MCHRRGLRQSGYGRESRPRPQVQEHTLAGNHPPFALIAHRDRLRGNEAAVPLDEVDAGVVVTADVDPDQVFDHGPLASLNRRHVRADRPDIQPEFRGACSQGLHSGAVNEVLARKAGDVGARSADVPSLDHGGAVACSGHRPRQVLPRLSAAEDQILVFFDVWHLQQGRRVAECLQAAVAPRGRDRIACGRPLLPVPGRTVPYLRHARCSPPAPPVSSAGSSGALFLPVEFGAEVNRVGSSLKDFPSRVPPACTRPSSCARPLTPPGRGGRRSVPLTLRAFS